MSAHAPGFAVGDRVVTLVGWNYCYGGSKFWRDPGMAGEVTRVDDDGVVTIRIDKFKHPCWVPFRSDQLALAGSERAA